MAPNIWRARCREMEGGTRRSSPATAAGLLKPEARSHGIGSALLTCTAPLLVVGRPGIGQAILLTLPRLGRLARVPGLPEWLTKGSCARVAHRGNQSKFVYNSCAKQGGKHSTFQIQFRYNKLKNSDTPPHSNSSASLLMTSYTTLHSCKRKQNAASSSGHGHATKRCCQVYPSTPNNHAVSGRHPEEGRRPRRQCWSPDRFCTIHRCLQDVGGKPHRSDLRRYGHHQCLRHSGRWHQLPCSLDGDGSAVRSI